MCNLTITVLYSSAQLQAAVEESQSEHSLGVLHGHRGEAGILSPRRARLMFQDSPGQRKQHTHVIQPFPWRRPVLQAPVHDLNQFSHDAEDMHIRLESIRDRQRLLVAVPSVRGETRRGNSPALERPELNPLSSTPHVRAVDEVQGRGAQLCADFGVAAQGSRLRPSSAVSAQQRSDGDAYLQRSRDSAFRARAFAESASFPWNGRRPACAGL